MWWVIGIVGVVYLATRKRTEPPQATEIQAGIEVICDCLLSAANDSELITQAAHNSGDNWTQSVQQLVSMQRIPSDVNRRPLWTEPQELPVLYLTLDRISAGIQGQEQIPAQVAHATSKPVTTQQEAMILVSELALWFSSVVASKYTLPSTTAYLRAGEAFAASPMAGPMRGENYVR
jgi:hypothetical protein